MGLLDDRRNEMATAEAIQAEIARQDQEAREARNREDVERAACFYRRIAEIDGKPTPFGAISVTQDGFFVKVSAGGLDLLTVKFWQQEGLSYSRDCEYSEGNGVFSPRRDCWYGVEWASSGRTKYGPNYNVGYGSDDATMAEFLIQLVDGKLKP